MLYYLLAITLSIPQHDILELKEKLEGLPYSQVVLSLEEMGTTPFALGTALTNHGHLREATDWFHLMSTQEPQKLKRANLLFGLAWSHWTRNDRGNALKEALNLKALTQEPQLLARADYLIGLIQHAWGKDQKAQEHFNKSLSYFEKLLNHQGQTRNYLALARVALSQKDFAQTQGYLEKAKKHKILSRDDSGLLETQLQEVRGDLAFYQQAYSQAQTHYQKALSLQNQPLGQRAWLTTKLALTYAFLGQDHQAQDATQKVSNWNKRLQIEALKYYNSLTTIRVFHCRNYQVIDMERAFKHWTRQKEPNSGLLDLLKTIKQRPCELAK